MKVAKPVNRQQLVDAIATVEANGPLSNRQTLYAIACEQYNIAMGASNPKLWITPSVVLLRIKEWNLAVITPVGKRGRPTGFKAQPKLDENGQPIPRKRKGRKASDESMRAMREGEFKGEQYNSLMAKIANGSLTARIKANCLACAGFVRAEIANCGCTGCPLWDVRPYRAGQAETETEGESDSANNVILVDAVDTPLRSRYALTVLN